MKDKIIQTLRDLRAYAVNKGIEAAIFYQEEDSNLMRFANSAISLNTNERLVRLEIIAYEDKRRASYELITSLSKLDEMKQGVDIAAEMVKHAQPLLYQPSVPDYAETFVDESGWDAALANLSSEERLAYFNEVSKGFETDEIKLSGIFSSGTNVIALINTHSDNVLYFKSSDAQITVVLSHLKLKWEVQAEQSAQKKTDLDAGRLHDELAFLLDHYQHDTPQQIPLGSYDIVFGAAAVAEILTMMNWIGFNGGAMKRGFAFIAEDQIGKKVFSEKFTLKDDANRLETFPFKRDFMGIKRGVFPIVKKGEFQAFTWFQDDADEFGAEPSGHNVMHQSLVVDGGDVEVNTLEELVAMPRDKDILYIPFIHYMNIVNPSKGLLTGTSRFGALLLKADGSVAVPYNVRVTQSMLDIFGDKVAWMSKSQTVYNTSQSYG
ncbi:MAG: metallopeptidase TldD-related protein, partial [Anaerolineaceae bacterium]|nr:metallopeptidase TldD-related protein [Anaerolineaceae bacterium]